MNETDMVIKAEQLGFTWPMKKLDSETLKCNGKDDIVFLRFVDDDVHVYSFKYTN